MFEFPKEPSKIRARIRRYERALDKEFEKTGFYSDGYGKRYLLGPLYLVLGDLDGALRSYEWFVQAFPDDVGEPFQYLCWALALYRSGDLDGATFKLRQAMLSNLYLIPELLGIEQGPFDIRHFSNVEQKDYLQYAPPEIWSLWDASALQWARETYDSPEFRQVRGRFVEIHKQLESEPRGPRRRALVAEASRLQGWE